MHAQKDTQRREQRRKEKMSVIVSVSLGLSLFALLPRQVSAPSVASVWKETFLTIGSGHQVGCLCQISCRPTVV